MPPKSSIESDVIMTSAGPGFQANGDRAHSLGRLIEDDLKRNKEKNFFYENSQEKASTVDYFTVFRVYHLVKNLSLSLKSFSFLSN
ncbi:hypothetical protein CEXT_179411 [Caerostris extrusa]|uniref:Uncharacterized protein n=1 Tax=Caerostris extrusa TaxID=172846 RepID=A0AAV4MBM5_CAEEX|nr:hypothetical protein CEXT_179411 [Caerostris extrusa]